MGSDSFQQPTDDLGRMHDDVVAEGAPADAAIEPPGQPWWNRLLERLFRRKARATVEAEAGPVTQYVPPPETMHEIPPAALSLPEQVVPEEVALPPEVPLEPGPPTAGIPSEAVASAISPLTPDGVRELVAAELAHVREDIVRTVRAGLVQEQEEERDAALTAVQGMTDHISSARLESIRAELEVLREEEERALQDHGKPVPERMETVDYIRERVSRAEREIVELEEATARRVAEVAQRRVELEGQVVIASLRQAVEKQKEALATLEARLASPPTGWPGRLSLWPTMVALVLVAAVGLAGILLPRQANMTPILLIEMAAMYRATGETEEAVRVLDEAVVSGIADIRTLGQVGEMYRNLKEYRKAIEVLKQVVQEDPHTQRYRLSLARSYTGAAEYWQAIAEYEALIEINPDNIWYHVEKGHTYKSLKLYDRAIDEYQNILEIDPAYWQAYYHQGEVYRLLEDYDEAVQHYQQALRIVPNDYWTLVKCGMSYAGKQDLARAIEQYQKAIQVAPDQAGAHYYLGEAYRAQESFVQAVESYQQAIDINHQYTAAYTALGKAYVALDNCTSAIVQFAAALRLSPKNAEAQEGLEVCMER